MAEIPHHEHIALIAVASSIPLLVDGDTIDPTDSGMFHDDHIVELYLDIAVGLEGAA